MECVHPMLDCPDTQSLADLTSRLSAILQRFANVALQCRPELQSTYYSVNFEPYYILQDLNNDTTSDLSLL